MRICDEPPLIAPADVRAHGDLPFVFPARNDARSAHGLDPRQLAERHARARRSRDEDSCDRGRVGTRVGDVAHRDVESTLALEQCTDRASADRELDDVLHVADVQPVPRQFGAIDGDSQLWLVRFLLNRRVGRAFDALHHVDHLPAETTKRREIRSADDDGEVGGGTRRDFRGRVDDRLRDVEAGPGDVTVQTLRQFFDEIALHPA